MPDALDPFGTKLLGKDQTRLLPTMTGQQFNARFLSDALVPKPVQTQGADTLQGPGEADFLDWFMQHASGAAAPPTMASMPFPNMRPAMPQSGGPTSALGFAQAPAQAPASRAAERQASGKPNVGKALMGGSTSSSTQGGVTVGRDASGRTVFQSGPSGTFNVNPGAGTYTSEKTGKTFSLNPFGM